MVSAFFKSLLLPGMLHNKLQPEKIPLHFKMCTLLLRVSIGKLLFQISRIYHQKLKPETQNTYQKNCISSVYYGTGILETCLRQYIQITVNTDIICISNYFLVDRQKPKLEYEKKSQLGSMYMFICSLSWFPDHTQIYIFLYIWTIVVWERKVSFLQSL